LTTGGKGKDAKSGADLSEDLSNSKSAKGVEGGKNSTDDKSSFSKAADEFKSAAGTSVNATKTAFKGAASNAAKAFG